MRSNLLLCVAILALSVAAQQAISFEAHPSTLHAFYSGEKTGQWTNAGRASGHNVHSFVIAPKLKGDAAATCDSLINKVSDMSSAHYGKYLDLAQVNSVFRSKVNIEKVQAWLSANDMTYTVVGDFIRVSAPVAAVESIFQAELHLFQNSKGQTIRRTPFYNLPAEISAHVDFVSSMTEFPAERKIRAEQSVVQKRQGGYVTPSTINTVYGISNNKVASVKSTQSLFEALGQQFSTGDLAAFQAAYNITDQPVAKVIGSNNGWWCVLNPNDCGEANLDVQYIMGVAQGSPTTFWVIDPNSQDPFLDWVVALAATQNPPLVHSISYGSIVSEEPKANILRYNTEICKLGLRGLTVFVASGDDGVANFEARGDSSQCGFNPSFPATSPYVTAVGATQGPESGQPEIACSSSTGGIITTGGGFSINFARPSYQAKVVANYLKNGPKVPPLNLFNSTGRGYPDVAVLGLNYEVYIDRFATPVSGTSASAPTFAGMITLVNGLRFKAGKPAVGFLNPALYSIAASTKGAFNDIKSGENNCCASGGPCCPYGFTASVGWDPLTGLGSPNFKVLSAALLRA